MILSGAASQGNNNIGVYNIPEIENVTENGYYLKTITGIVSYVNSNQLYVVSDDDITIYDIDASSNDENMGTVSKNGYMVIASPASETIGYDDPAYVEETSATNYSIQQTGNYFKVITNGDIAIEIQFAPAPTNE